MLTALEFNQVPAQEAAFRTEIRQFLNKALVGMPSHAKARSWMGTSDDFSKKLAKQGWLGLTIPKEYGGSGKGFTAAPVASARYGPVKRRPLEAGSDFTSGFGC